MQLKSLMITLFRSPNVKNASWIIFGKIMQMLISVIVSMLTARYLGPQDYGVINYAGSYIAFFTALSTLGINSILVKELIEEPEKQGETIGTTIVLRFASSVLSILTIFAIVSLVDYNEPTTKMVVFLCSLRLIFEVFETFDYWFQSKLRSRIPTIAKTIAIVVVSIYKILILYLGKNVFWFAVSTSLDYFVFAIILLIIYYKSDGQPLAYSCQRAISLLRRSNHFILSGIAISIYGYTDRLMIKQMLTSAEVGYYSVAKSTSEMWTFVLIAIIDSVRPTIMQMFSKNTEIFYKRLIQLYSIIIYLSFFVSFMFVLVGYPIILFLYGEDYIFATSSLKIITWSTAFSYLGVARNIWIVCENKQRYLLSIYAISAVINVVLNYYLIENLGIDGAAITAVITQVISSLIIPSFYKDLQFNSKLILEAFVLPCQLLRR